jgi:hypothetical protein
LAEIEHLGLCNPADYEHEHDEHATTMNATHGTGNGTSDGRSCTCEESGGSHHRRLAGGGTFHSYQVKGLGVPFFPGAISDIGPWGFKDFNV